MEGQKKPYHILYLQRPRMQETIVSVLVNCKAIVEANTSPQIRFFMLIYRDMILKQNKEFLSRSKRTNESDSLF